MAKKFWFLIIFAYLVTRLINLMALPIFNDEVFFIWAGRRIVSNPVKNIFLNFSDGKEPLFFWLYSLPVKLFPDPLLGIRLFTIVLGLASLIYFLRISQKLKLNVFLAGLAFIVNPFILFYERIGMQETLLTFLLLAGSYYLLINKKILTGLFLGLALLTKTSALALIVFTVPFFLIKKNYLTLLVMILIYLPIIFGLTNVTAHNSGYIGLINWQQILANFKQVISWSADYLGWPMTVVGFPALLPAFLEGAIAKIFFPRYFLFCAPFVILLSAWLLRKLNWLFLLILIPNLILSFQIVSNIPSAPLPAIERWQYLESWPSGYGIREVAEFLKEQNAQKIVVEDIMITRYGLPYYYSGGSYQVGGIGDWYVFTRQQEAPADKSLILRFSIPKTGIKERISVWSTQ